MHFLLHLHLPLLLHPPAPAHPPAVSLPLPLSAPAPAHPPAVFLPLPLPLPGSGCAPALPTHLPLPLLPLPGSGCAPAPAPAHPPAPDPADPARIRMCGSLTGSCSSAGGQRWCLSAGAWGGQGRLMCSHACVCMWGVFGQGLVMGLSGWCVREGGMCWEGGSICRCTYHVCVEGHQSVYLCTSLVLCAFLNLIHNDNNNEKEVCHSLRSISPDMAVAGSSRLVTPYGAYLHARQANEGAPD